MDVNEKDECSTTNNSELQGCDDKINCDDIVSPFYLMAFYRYWFEIHCMIMFLASSWKIV